LTLLLGSSAKCYYTAASLLLLLQPGMLAEPDAVAAMHTLLTPCIPLLAAWFGMLSARPAVLWDAMAAAFTVGTAPCCCHRATPHMSLHNDLGACCWC
jgi:hypothetical protein